ncbi:MAG TPA: family 1 glycosylhydrolase [Kofleriaceae bacterium]|nr:family 1 glycosylhydrolase [Kofleriaceae bacterium]
MTPCHGWAATANDRFRGGPPPGGAHRTAGRPATAVALALTLACAGGCGDDPGEGGGDDGGGEVDAGSGPDAAPLPDPIGQFPGGFLWGSAIAPYQVEGGLHATDWYRWETLCGTACSGQSADDGPDFFAHYADDLDAASAMGQNAIRIGIDWARVFPAAESFPAAPVAEEVARYHDVIGAARERGMQVMVTLIHFDLPIWIDDLDDPEAAAGWEDPAIVDRFAEFAGWAAAEYGAEIDLWITLNEPFVNVVGGWISGSVPPGAFLDVDTALEVGERMIYAHAAAYDAIHAADTIDADGDGDPARVSIAQHSRVFLPKDPTNEAQVAAADMFRYLLNDFFLRGATLGDIDRNYDFDADDEGDTKADPALVDRLDFIGLNYYGVTLVVETSQDSFPLIGLPLQNDLQDQGFDAPVSDFGWSIYPAGLRQVLDELAPYQLPIIITENGIADGADAQRPRFLIEHLYELGRAIDDGIPIEGYFHWSLMDNFEWGSGYCPRFGLLRVDFDDPSRARTPGEGAAVYQRIIEANTVDPALFGQYAYGEPGFCPRLAF